MLSFKFRDLFDGMKLRTLGAASSQKMLPTSLSAKNVRFILAALISIWIGGTLAKLFLIFLSAGNTEHLPRAEINPVKPLSAVESASINIDRLVERALFGSHGNQQIKTNPSVYKPEGIESSAVETRLDIELRGIVAFSADGSGVAIIENDDKQRLYSVGDRITVKSTNRIILAKVMQNSVVLDNGGAYELLTLFKDSELDKLQPISVISEPVDLISKSNQSKTETVTRISKNAGRQIAAYRDAIYADPAEIMKSIRIKPVTQENSLIGYQVASSAGGTNELIKLLGLRAGDIITEVNGIVLDDPSNTVSLYQELKDSSALYLSLLRDGDMVSLSVDLEDV